MLKIGVGGSWVMWGWFLGWGGGLLEILWWFWCWEWCRIVGWVCVLWLEEGIEFVMLELWLWKWRGSKVCLLFVFVRVFFVGWFVMKMDYNICMVFIDVKINLGF